MIVELIVSVSLIFGIVLGWGISENQTKPNPPSTPSEWQPAEHRSNMLQCRAVCGKDKVESYDSLTGECKCKK